MPTPRSLCGDCALMGLIVAPGDAITKADARLGIEELGGIMTQNAVVSSIVRPADILITSELFRRPDRLVQLEAELNAFRELAATMKSDPQAAVNRFLEFALELCDAGSAGISMLRQDAAGAAMFHWDALAGAFARYQGGTTPRDHSPCGLCLDSGGPVVVSRPARLFTYFESAEPHIAEGLVVPLYDNARQALGTLWIVHHDDSSHFAPNDVRVMEQLASQLVLALKLIEERRTHARVLTDAEARINDSERQRDDAVRELIAERERREQAEISESGLWQIVSEKDALIKEINHRVKNSIQTTMSLLALQARTSRSAEARDVLREAQTRLQVQAKVHELLYRSADNAQEVPMPALLNSLAAALEQSFADLHSRVRLKLDVGNIVLNPDQAIPIALLMNEVITNAYKHAFPGGTSGEIGVRLHAIQNQQLTLEIRDDGIGLPADPSEGSLGLRLVRSFASQLRGDLVIEGHSRKGTSVILTMPLQPAQSS